jgi:hypothetical protein
MGGLGGPQNRSGRSSGEEKVLLSAGNLAHCQSPYLAISQNCTNEMLSRNIFLHETYFVMEK